MKINKKISKNMIKKIYVGIIPILFITLFLCMKPAVKSIIVKSDKYKTPANSAFTDMNFYKCVVDAYNSANNTNLDYDVNLTSEQLASITFLQCSGHNKNIESVDGIGELVSLKSLEFGGINASSLDLSNNVNLTSVNITGNMFTTVNFSNNTKLRTLYLVNNKLINVDLTDSTSLEFLEIDEAELADLKLSHTSMLEHITLSAGQLTSLDLSNNTALKNVSITNNKLTSINLSNDSLLKNLYLSGNPLTELNLDSNLSLEELTLYDTHLSNLNLSHNALLKKLILNDSQLTNIDLSNNTALDYLFLKGDNITSLNLDNTVLISLELYTPLLTSIDLRHNTLLSSLSMGYYDSINNVCYNSELSNLDLSSNTALTSLNLNCFSNLNSLNLDNNTSLKNLKVTHTSLSNLNLSSNTLLEDLDLSNNRLKSLDLSHNTSITSYPSPYYRYRQESEYVIYKNDLSSINEQKLRDAISADNTKDQYIVEYPMIDSDGSNKTFEFEYSIKRVEITSDKYVIDENNGFIYTGNDTNNTILDNISLTQYEGVTGSIDDNKYVIKYNNDVVKKFDLVNYSSNKYDLSGDSVNVKDNNIQSFLNNITCVNCNAYIYNGSKNITSGSFDENYKLRIVYNNEIKKEFSLNYLVTNVTLNRNELKLNLNNVNTYKLLYNITPVFASNKNVIWESSNPNVATVSDGVVTAVGYGEVTITVKTVDGDLTDTCIVTVGDFPEYNVTYKWNDGTQDKTKVVKTILGENVIQKFSELLYVQGKKIIGWKYGTRVYSFNESFSMPNEDIELVAQYADVMFGNIEYEVDVDGNNKYLSGIDLNIDVNNLSDLDLGSEYKIKVFNKDGETLKTSGNIGTGDVIKVYVNDNQDYLVETYTVVIKGDLNGNGEVNVMDLVALRSYVKVILNNNDIEYFYKIAGDLNGNGKVNIMDLVALRSYIKELLKPGGS